MAKKSSIKVWTHFDGEPGVEYEESGGYVAIRVWKNDGYRQAGPIRLLGSTESTIRRLLKEMRTLSRDLASLHRAWPQTTYNNNWNVSPDSNPYTGERGRDRPTLRPKALDLPATDSGRKSDAPL